MAKLITFVKGLYHFLKNSKVLPCPLTQDGWALFYFVCTKWADGYPTPMQFGACMAFSENLEGGMKDAAMEMIQYSEKTTDKTLACFQVYPQDLATIVSHPIGDAAFGAADPLNSIATLGWKKTYAWEPL